MIEPNEVNSTFYALRLLSHGLDTSQIGVTDGEEYPASEFTREEQEQALEIIHHIEGVESVSINQLSLDQIDFYLTALADRIEELANSDLANAGYAVETTLPRPYERDTESPPTRHQEAVSRSESEDAARQIEGDEVVMLLPMGGDYELLAGTTVEQLARRLNFRPEVVNEIKTAIVEACINISEHSLSSDRKIYQRFRVENDKLIVTISSRGIVPTNVHTREQTTGAVDKTSEWRRGWGLQLIKTLMDEVEFERVDEGTSLRMTKYRKS